MNDVCSVVGLVTSLLFIWERLAEYRKKQERSSQAWAGEAKALPAFFLFAPLFVGFETIDRKQGRIEIGKRGKPWKNLKRWSFSGTRARRGFPMRTG